MNDFVTGQDIDHTSFDRFDSRFSLILEMNGLNLASQCNIQDLVTKF